MYLCQGPKDFLTFWKQFSILKVSSSRQKDQFFFLDQSTSSNQMCLDVFSGFLWPAPIQPIGRGVMTKPQRQRKKVTRDWFAGPAITGVVMVTSLQRFQIRRNHAHFLGTAKAHGSMVLSASAVRHVLTRCCHLVSADRRHRVWSRCHERQKKKERLNNVRQWRRWLFDWLTSGLWGL